MFCPAPITRFELQLDLGDGQDIDDLLWNTESAPQGSGATLSDPRDRFPTFTPDLAGEYVISLIVQAGGVWSDPDTVTITAEGTAPPIADAGDDAAVVLGATAFLNGSGSYDPDGEPITDWEWTFTSVPPGSVAALMDADTALPWFDPDLLGNYIVQLRVRAGGVWSAPDSVTITAAEDQPPIADAGPDQIVPIGALVQLDASGSYDPDGHIIFTWEWTLVSRPPGSTALLSDPMGEQPTFTADLKGVYELSLRVFSLGPPGSGGLWSNPDTVTVTANTAPVADAGPDAPDVPVGFPTLLNGSGSYDPDGDPLTDYLWEVVSAPPGSTAAPQTPHVVTTWFTPDKIGEYSVSLTVFDGVQWSPADTVVITAYLNQPPVADAGPDQPAAPVGFQVHLDGSGSFDPEGQPITAWDWAFTSVPAGSGAVLVDADTATPWFEPDLPGDYIVSLAVFDNLYWSPPDTVVVTAYVNQPPSALASADPLEGYAPLLVQFDGTQSYDPEGGDLVFDWDFDDGTPHGGEPAPLHEYAQAGTYVAVMAATDALQQTAYDTVEITVWQRGDMNADGVVDASDQEPFLNCLGAPEDPPPGGCVESADMDLDGDVDLADFAAFQALFGV